MKIHLGLVSSYSMGLSRWLLSKSLPLQAWWPEFDLQNPCKQSWTWGPHVLLKAVLVTQRWLCSCCSLDIQPSLIGKFQCSEWGGRVWVSEEQHPWLSSILHTPHTHTNAKSRYIYVNHLFYNMYVNFKKFSPPFFYLFLHSPLSLTILLEFKENPQNRQVVNLTSCLEAENGEEKKGALLDYLWLSQEAV